MTEKNSLINNIFIFILILWTFLAVFFALLYAKQNYQNADEMALHTAKLSVKKDLAYRSWVASHGGVYVPVDKNTPPNPYLAHIKTRDVLTNANQHLTLMNPAYTLSQMMKDYSKLYGIKGHITSLTLLNPKNKPDNWERKALHEIDKTQKPVIEKVKKDGKEYLRYINPIFTNASCLKCHAFQGYKIGDVRGGVSVSIPLEEYYSGAFNNTKVSFIYITISYFLGIIFLIFAYKIAKKILKEKIHDYEQHLYSLVNIIERRDSYTAGHSKRVTHYATAIAQKMGYDKETIEKLYTACMLHDIGKISIPDSVLLKPSKLSQIEFNIIKEHSVIGYELLKDVDLYKDIAKIVKHHHERFDGNGYPDGLKGNEIPQLSMIMTVADAYDAMTTDRIYKAKKDISTALNELKKLSNIQFSKEVVNAAVKILPTIKLEENINQLPKTELEKARFAYFFKDNTTNSFNLDYLKFILIYNHKEGFDFNFIDIIYLHKMTEYNEKHGWKDGSEFLRRFVEILQEKYKDGVIFRIHGDDFIILTKEKSHIKNYVLELKEILNNLEIEFSYQSIDIAKEEIKTVTDIEKIMQKK
jgi:putative nucleotidyltransferase with HDIG domain